MRCRSITLAEGPATARSVIGPWAGAPEAPLEVPVKVRSLSRIMLRHLCFVVEDRITSPDGDAPECSDWLSIELLNPKEYVGLVHGLQVEVGSDDTVAVDDGSTHICPYLRCVRSLDRSSTCRSRRETVQASHEQVNEIGCINTRQLGDVNVGDSDCIAPIPRYETDLPFEVIPICLVCISSSILNWPFTQIPVL